MNIDPKDYVGKTVSLEFSLAIPAEEIFGKFSPVGKLVSYYYNYQLKEGFSLKSGDKIKIIKHLEHSLYLCKNANYLFAIHDYIITNSIKEKNIREMYLQKELEIWLTAGYDNTGTPLPKEG